MAAKKTKTTKTKKTASKTTAKKKIVKRSAPAKASVTAKKSAKKSPAKKVASKKAAPKTAVNEAKPPKAANSNYNAAWSSTLFDAQPPMMEIFKMTKTPFQFDQLAQEATEASREGFEAFVKSGTIFAKGFEDLMKVAANISQNAAEKQTEFAKQLMSSKTLNEFAETQNKIAQANFDQFMAGATKLSEMSVKVLSDGSEPINSQLNKTMQKANKAMAA